MATTISSPPFVCERGSVRPRFGCGNQVIWTKEAIQWHDEPKLLTCAQCGVVLDGYPSVIDGENYCGICAREAC